MAKEVPIWEKVCMTIEEASAYSNIGTTNLRNIIREPSCPFVLMVGNRYLVKKKEFDRYISGCNKI